MTISQDVAQARPNWPAPSQTGSARVMKRALEHDEREAFEALLRATKRVKALIVELLCAEERQRRSECAHAFERLYSDGCRDNNDYDLVCRRCGVRM